MSGMCQENGQNPEVSHTNLEIYNFGIFLGFFSRRSFLLGKVLSDHDPIRFCPVSPSPV